MRGVFTAVGPGQTTVTAAAGGRTATATVEVPPIRLIGRAGDPFPRPNLFLSYPRLVVDGTGAATAAWSFGTGEVFSGGHDGTDWTERVQVNAEQELPDQGILRTLTANDAGARVMAWTGFESLYASYARPGEAFGPLEPVPTGLSRLDRTFQGIVASVVTTSGDVIFLWRGAGQSFVSRRSAATNLWWPRALLESIYLSAAAFNASGDAVIAWQIYDPSNQRTSASSTSPPAPRPSRWR
ncbi:MAG TPA: hypothetical protein VK698_23510 [Kofleriaceae bacterium]|nr:hypothetical protein [Kofleriaceae bacterium]